jgi:alpha-L-fucosidase
MKKKDEKFRDSKDRVDWFKESKFGLFIHWGAYTVAGVEASWPTMAPDLSVAMFKNKKTISEEDYLKLPEEFNPTEFNPDEWVRMAKDAGMRYIIITAKHHDGFCMFNAPGTEYKITNTPYGKDICLELSEACAKAGIRLGFYYSPPDMNHPGYRNHNKVATKNWLGEPKRREWEDYLDYMESHIRKLLTDYGDVSIIWFDALTNYGKYDPQRFHKLIREISPNTLINDRIGDGFDYVTPEQFIPDKGIPARTGKPPAGVDPGGDAFFKTVLTLFKVPGIRGFLNKQLQKYAEGDLELTPVFQEKYPSPERFQPWETCMTMGNSWAHNPTETDWKTPDKLVRNLVEVVSRGGNYLLNVGPTAKGEFPTEAVSRLQHIGQWMSQNNESIYGATYTPLDGLSWGRATRKGDKVFLHVFNMPTENKLIINSFPGEIKTVSLMTGGGIAYSHKEQQLELTLPSTLDIQDVLVIEVVVKGLDESWGEYSAAVETKITPNEYIQKQAVSNFIINAILNGVIAFFMFRLRDVIPFEEASIDILITVGILGSLISWLGIGSVKGEIIKGNLSKSKIRGLKLPKGVGIRVAIIMMICVIGFGGFIVDGGLYLISPDGLSNWVYIVLKTLYTGAAAAIASWLAILSVLGDENRS